MGQAELDIVKRFTEALASQDMETTMALMHPEIVFVETAGLPYEGEWKGPEGIGQLAQEIMGAYDYEVEGMTHHDGGDRVFVQLRCKFTSRKSGASTVVPIVEVYEVQDGQVIRNNIYYQDVPALVGLDEAAA